MATTVKIREIDKEKLDFIKARMLLKGIKLNQEELLGKIISIADTHPSLIDDESAIKLTDEEIDDKLKTSFKMGISSHETIDEDLYGEK